MKLYNSVGIFLSWPACVTSAIGNSKRLPELTVVSNLGNLYIYIIGLYVLRPFHMQDNTSTCVSVSSTSKVHWTAQADGFLISSLSICISQ
jgi:hypothetical protein